MNNNPGIELLRIGAVVAFNLAIDLRTARRDVQVRDPEVSEVPRKVGADFIPMIGFG